ncbi:hypothetical protein [Allomuricauda sp. d1]|uniref:hypothetical protein n=1 Tax=Allomuricauda sp. d1 TaxID=3136725 RepID=UPI0031CDDAE2
MIARYICLLGVLIAFSCKSQKANTKMEASNNELQLVLEDSYFPVEEKQAMVIRDEKSLMAFFSKVNQTRKPGLPVPDIDFDNEMAVIVCAGALKGSRMPHPEKKQESEESYDIVIKNRPANQNVGKEVVIYPFSVYKMPKTDKKIDFHWQ